MAPCIDDSSSKTVETQKHPSNTLQLSTLRKALPERVFEKSLIKSLSYMVFDLSMWGLSFYAIWTLSTSAAWSTMPLWQRALASVLYWNVAGFFMWCIFVVGHDCGHGTFSENELLNDIIGHFLHGSILVPYFPWQLSHRRHHMYHNHVEKDYSHPWYPPEKLSLPEEELARWAERNSYLRFSFPIIGWPLYLYGMPDGSHFVPFAEQRIWKESPSSEYTKCHISSFIVLLNAVAIYWFFHGDLKSIAFFYTAPWFVMGWWLTSVTYLQHHNHDTFVYNDSNWSFVTAAFETIDRTYGFGIDTLHHHISDGHVIHHLFFTKIPHYHLPEATRALVAFLKQQNLEKLYKHEMTRDFFIKSHQYFVQIGFKTRLFGSDNLVENKQKSQ